MLEGGIIAKLLDEKWTTYAKVGDYIENNLFHFHLVFRLYGF